MTLPRLTRRRWLAAARGLIVITPELIREIIALANDEAPELAAKLQAWLKEGAK